MFNLYDIIEAEAIYPEEGFLSIIRRSKKLRKRIMFEVSKARGLMVEYEYGSVYLVDGFEENWLNLLIYTLGRHDSRRTYPSVKPNIYVLKNKEFSRRNAMSKLLEG